jgi:uncharacterized membrane protein
MLDESGILIITKDFGSSSCYSISTFSAFKNNLANLVFIALGEDYLNRLFKL